MAQIPRTRQADPRTLQTTDQGQRFGDKEARYVQRRLMRSLLLTACIAMLILGTFLVFFARHQYIKDAETQALNQAKVFRNYLLSAYEDLARYQEQGVSGYPTAEAEEIMQDLASLSKETGLRITLMDSKGVVFADTGLTNAEFDYEHLGSHNTRPEVVQAISEGVGIAIRYSETLGADMMYCALPVRDDENRTLGVLRVSYPLNLIEKELSRNWPLFAGVIITALTVAFIAALIQSKNLSRPIELMSQMSAEMAKGSFDRYSVPKTGTELDELAEMMNSLASSLDLYISELTKSNTKMKTILDTSISGILLVTPDGKISSMNPSASRILGYPNDLAEGMPLHAVVRNLDICNLFEDALRESSIEKKEVRLYYPSEITLEVTALPLAGENPASYEIASTANHGEADSPSADYMLPEKANGRVPEGVLIILYDLTELRRLETTRSDFIQNISHELRTPITIIKGFAETLAEAPPEDKKTIQEMSSFITKEVSRLSTLVEDLLDLANLESGSVRFEPIWLDATAIVQETIKKMEPIAAEKEQTILFEPVLVADSGPGYESGKIPVRSVKVYADPSMFDTVLANLLDNAIKYSGHGSDIAVSLHELRAVEGKISEPPATRKREDTCLPYSWQDLSAANQFAREVGRGGVVLVVSDTGPGIPSEDLPRIFERFYRSSKDRSRARGGSGLGLSLVKHCANMHGGKAWAQSNPGERTSFFVWFPDPYN